MPIDIKEIKEFESEYKERIFNKVGEVCTKQNEVISQIQEVGKFIEIETDLPNIGITLNNKLVELQHAFQNAGLSMYVNKDKDADYVSSSFVGRAVIFDLIDYAIRGTGNLVNYNKSLKESTDKNLKKKQSLEKANPIRKFFAKIRNFFVPIKQEDMTFTPEEIETINSHIEDYRETDKQLWKYNLRDNIVSSIVKRIIESRYCEDSVSGLLEESVYPDLKKLGLEDLIPQLQQKLIEENKKDLPDYEIWQVKEEINPRPEVSKDELDR